MKLICTLGNIGDKYEKTRHNMGFFLADYIAKQTQSDFKLDAKLYSYILKTVINNEEIMVIKPTTFMNNSGQALRAVMNFYKIRKQDILVVYDDISLNLGYMRFRAKGSDGGHNGIKSVIKWLSNKDDFDRLKLGIGPQPPYMPSEKFVLAKFNYDELKTIEEIIEKAYEAFEIWLESGIIKAQSKYNGLVIKNE